MHFSAITAIKENRVNQLSSSRSNNEIRQLLQHPNIKKSTHNESLVITPASQFKMTPAAQSYTEVFNHNISPGPSFFKLNY
jgi:phage pi2 protein 07